MGGVLQTTTQNFILWLVKASAVGNSSHTLSYSLIGLQEMNLAYKYPVIFWDTAVLISDAGAVEDSDKSTNYGKIATNIAIIQKQGVKVEPPYINEAERQFIPDAENNSVMYGLKSINGIGDDVVDILLKNRPYANMQDFYVRMIQTKLIKTSQMIKLIKAGCFGKLMHEDIRVVMKSYLNNLFEHHEKLTMQNFPKIEEYDIIPAELNLELRMKHFKDYVLSNQFMHDLVIIQGKKVPKCGYHDRIFTCDENSQPFFEEYFSEDSVTGLNGEYYLFSEKKFLKEYKTKIQPLVDWISSQDATDAFNEYAFNQLAEKHAKGSNASWEMDALTCYLNDHELSHVRNELYSISNYFDMAEEAPIEGWNSWKITKKDGSKEWKHTPKRVISRIAGAVLDVNKYKSYITLLTVNGVVTVKLSKGHYAFYAKQISQVQPDGTKKVMEKSWFTRGNLLIISGYRDGDVFRAYRYKDTVYQHVCNLITNVHKNGTIDIQTERIRINNEQSND